MKESSEEKTSLTEDRQSQLVEIDTAVISKYVTVSKYLANIKFPPKRKTASLKMGKLRKYYRKIQTNCTDESLSEALLFAEYVYKKCSECTQDVLPRFELGIFMY